MWVVHKIQSFVKIFTHNFIKINTAVNTNTIN